MTETHINNPSNFSIRDVPIYGDLILAPMAGFSDHPFRLLCRQNGSAISYSEFIAADAIIHKARTAMRLLRYTEDERPVTFQVFDNNEDRIVEACRILEAMKPDFIDLNMGCSVDNVAGRGAGAGLLCDPAKIGRIFNRLSNTLKIPVTGKIRLGWDDSSRNHVTVARILEDNGASLIAVHGRTKAQLYRGQADWSAIGEVKQAVKIPVLGNGDVKTIADIQRIKEQTGCDGVMIGRAAIGNPWIFSRKESHEIPVAQKAALFRKHLDWMLEHYGEELGLILFRKQVVKYIQSFPGMAENRIKLLTCTKKAEFERLIADIEQPAQAELWAA